MTSAKQAGAVTCSAEERQRVSALTLSHTRCCSPDCCASGLRLRTIFWCLSPVLPLLRPSVIACNMQVMTPLLMHAMHGVQLSGSLHDQQAIRRATTQDMVALLTYDVRFLLVLCGATALVRR